MANNRRMVSNRIIRSAKFLKMPLESQALYFHLILSADDDGVVESYPLMKMLGVAPDSFKVLLSKKFIIQLNEDQVVVITNWLEHNKIRSDRKKDSIYKDLLLEVIPDIKLLESTKKTNVRQMSDKCPPKLSKVKLSKEKKEVSSYNKKPFFRGEAMRKSQGKWWVLPEDGGDWLEFAGEEDEIKWK